MRILKFNVDRQIINQDPTCDFNGLVPGTEGYLKAEFTFSSEWSDCVKVARFYSAMGVEYEPQAISAENTCLIPAEALKRQIFKVSVIGKNHSGKKLTTDKVMVTQDGR